MVCSACFEARLPPDEDRIGRRGGGFHGARVAAGERSFAWGCFRIAQVFLHGDPIGWGATCNRHLNAGDSATASCKKQLPYGGTRCPALSDDECVRHLKRWLLRGFTISQDGIASRNRHLEVKPRELTEPVSDEALDAELARCMAIEAVEA